MDKFEVFDIVQSSWKWKVSVPLDNTISAIKLQEWPNEEEIFKTDLSSDKCFDCTSIASQQEGPGLKPWVGPRVNLDEFSFLSWYSSHSPKTCTLGCLQAQATFKKRSQWDWPEQIKVQFLFYQTMYVKLYRLSKNYMNFPPFCKYRDVQGSFTDLFKSHFLFNSALNCFYISEPVGCKKNHPNTIK